MRLLGIKAVDVPKLLKHLICYAILLLVIVPAEAKQPSTLANMEEVKGSWCYGYGDEDTIAHAKRKSIMMAQEQAVRSYRVFVKSQSRVRNFQLEEDVIEMASAAVLQNIVIDKQETKERQVCTTISAMISPVSLEELIDQQVNAKDIQKKVELSIDEGKSSTGLSIRTNRPDGQFYEGDQLIIYVTSKEDTYIKIDYFQADGTVVHLVPNRYRKNSLIKKNNEYAFGDSTGKDSFIIQGPFGAESIKVSVSPMPFLIPQDMIENSRKSLRKERSGTRGVRVGASSSVQLHTTSVAVENYRKEKLSKN